MQNMKAATRIAAIIFIFGCTAVAWMILGVTIVARTDYAGSSLGYRVNANWGTPHQHTPPTAHYVRVREVKTETEQDGQTTVKTTKEEEDIYLPLEATRIDASLDLNHRQKGLLWYSTYKVGFAGEFAFRNSSGAAQSVTFSFPFPTQQAIFDELSFEIDGRTVEVENLGEKATARVTIAAGRTARFRVGYQSQGLNSWRYSFGEGIAQVKDFELNLKTNFADINFPEDTLSATSKRGTTKGWDLMWSYGNLLSGYQVGIEMPERLQPGPLAGRISFFAPVSLFFFFFLTFILTTLRGIDLHPMNYFFLAAAFFSFHLLLAYLVDHLSIHTAMVISSIVSLVLVVTYLRLLTGWRFALLEAGLSQLVYLILFSYAFFLEGFTGLTITVISILTLFVVMQMTGRVNWSDVFAENARTDGK